jgi:hypothetical protein
LARSTNDYHSVLGLTIDFTVPGWTFLSRGSFRVMPRECADALPPSTLGDHSWYGYVTVSDASALLAEFQAAGADFTRRFRTNPGVCESLVSVQSMVIASCSARRWNGR